MDEVLSTATHHIRIGVVSHLIMWGTGVKVVYNGLWNVTNVNIFCMLY